MSIRTRLTIYWAIVTGAILVTTGLLILFAFSRQLWGTLDRALLEEADTIAGALSHSNGSKAPPLLQRLVRENDDPGAGRRVRLIVDARVTFDHGNQAIEPQPDLPASRTGIVEQGRARRTRFAVVPLQIDGHNAWLQDGVDAHLVSRTVAHLRRTLLLMLPAIFILCVAGGYWLSAWALIPVKMVSVGLSRINPDALQQRLPIPAVHDEVRTLVDAINELLKRLERASAAQRRFLSEAAHELRTPLTVLRSGLDVALQRPRSIEDSRAAMEEALSEVEKLCASAEDLLALARIEASQTIPCELVDLATIVASAANRTRSLALSKQQRLVLKTDAALIVRGSSGDLERVVLNLLGNAVKFTPEGGTIEIVANRAGLTAVLSVRDTGPGVEPAELPRIFDPFYSSHQSNGDSGLGLALCREIVRLHNGTIEAANRKAGGCEILVRLPIAAEAT